MNTPGGTAIVSVPQQAQWWDALLPPRVGGHRDLAHQLEMRAVDIPADLAVWLPNLHLEAVRLEDGTWVMARVQVDGTRAVVAEPASLEEVVGLLGELTEGESESLPISGHPAYGIPVAILQCPHGELVMVKSYSARYQAWFHPFAPGDRRDLVASRWSLGSLLRWATGPKGPLPR